MCLLLIAHDCCPGFRLVVVANRDEYHQRPTAPAAYWHDQPHILAGRDLESHGTWLGLNAAGRFATVTNVRAGQAVQPSPRSRGLLVSDFLLTTTSAPTYAETLVANAGDYDGFNLLAHDGRALSWYSNQAAAPRHLNGGVYTLSNAALDTAWPKTRRLRAGFARIMAARPPALVDELLGLLRDPRRAARDELPNTGIETELESALSAIFIEGGAYGTRCSTVVTIDEQGQVCFHERRYDAAARVSGDSRFEFVLPREAA